MKFFKLKLLIVSLKQLLGFELYLDKNFENFFKNLSENNSILFDSPFTYFNLPNSNLKEIALNIFSGQLWKNSNTSVKIADDISIINLFESNISYSKSLEWIIEVNRQFQINTIPTFLYELNKYESIGIKCPQCYVSKNYWWYKMNFKNNRSEILLTTERIRLVNDTLYISSFLLSDSGVYFCLNKKYNDTFLDHTNINTVKFFLLFKYPLKNVERKQVIDIKNVKLVNLTKELFSFEDKPKEFYIDKSSELIVYTLWQEWSLCGDCNRNSLRNRIGNCHVIFNSTNYDRNYELHEIQKLFYPNGGSCQLGVYLEYFSENFTILDLFNNYNHYDICNIDCAIYESIQDSKSVEEISNFFNSDEYPTKQSISLPPLLNGEYQFKTPSININRFQGESLKLLCLYNNLEDNHKISWSKNDVKTLTMQHKNNKNKLRTHFVNDYNEYEMNGLKLSDSGVYKCYYNSKLVMIIKLDVVSNLLKPFDSREDNYDFYMDYVLSLCGLFSFLVFYYSVIKYFNSLLLTRKQEIIKKN